MSHFEAFVHKSITALVTVAFEFVMNEWTLLGLRLKLKTIHC